MRGPAARARLGSYVPLSSNSLSLLCQVARVRESLRSVRPVAAASSAASSAGAAALDPRELDPLLGELTILHARTELYVRFVRRRVMVSGDWRAGGGMLGTEEPGGLGAGSRVEE